MKNTLKRIVLAAALMASFGVHSAQAQFWSLTGTNSSGSDIFGTSSTATTDLIFKVNNTERMRILDANGNIGIGNTNPQRKVHVSHFGAPQLRLQDGTGSWDFWAGGNFHFREVSSGSDWMILEANSNRMRIGLLNQLTVYTNTGNVGIGLSTVTLPASRLTVAGDITPTINCNSDIGSLSRRWNFIYACNGTIQTSDANLKENIQEITYGREALMKLRPVSFTWKGDPGYGVKLGFLAQEVKQVIGEVVKTGDNEAMGVFYSDLLPVIVKGLQEQEGISVDRAKEHAAHQRKSSDLDARLARLEAAAGLRTLSGVESPDFSANGVTLNQNDPNPTDGLTTISYFIPESVVKADLVISDISTGKEVSRSAVNGRGNGEMEISVKDITPGTYIYSIVADGKLSASRKMVVAK